MRKVLIVAVCASGLLFAQRSPMDTAWDLVAKGDHPQAVRVLEQFIKTNPANADARLLLGSIFTEDGKGSDAVAQLTEAVRLKPKSAEAHQALGEALRKFGNLAVARGEFEKAVQLDPNFAQARVDFGLALLEAGEHAPAAIQLDRAIVLLARDAEAAYPRYLRAKIHTENNEIEKTAQQLKAAVALRPDFAEAWSDLGQARKMLADDDGALAAFERSIQVDPENAVAQYRLGAEYLRRGDAHRAVAHLQQSFRLNPKDQSMLYSLQLALRQDGQAEEALRVKQKLAEVLRDIDRVSQAEFTALRLNNEGAALEKQKDLKSAIEKYRQAVALDPNHIGIRTNYAVALLRLGYWKDGIGELREVLRRDPHNELVKATLKDALEKAPAEAGGKGRLKQ